MEPIYKTRSIFRSGDVQRINQSIADAERQTSGEIALMVSRYCWGDIREKARRLFHQNNLHLTKQRNAVMILIVAANRECLIYGDKGIHEKVDAAFWPEACKKITERAAADSLADGVVDAIGYIGESLAEYFPATRENANEIPDGVIHED